MSYRLNLGWGGPIGDYICRVLGASIQGFTTNLVQGSIWYNGLVEGIGPLFDLLLGWGKP